MKGANENDDKLTQKTLDIFLIWMPVDIGKIFIV